MSGTKILVLHLKEIIKAGVFAIIGIILLIAIIYFFMPQEQNTSPQALLDYSKDILDEVTTKTFVPGTYYAQVSLSNKPANVKVTVTEKEITDIALSDVTKKHEIFYPLLMPTLYELAKEIIETQSLDVTTSYENAITSQVLVNAISRALYEATPQVS